jgi:hypothetical protein
VLQPASLDPDFVKCCPLSERCLVSVVSYYNRTLYKYSKIALRGLPGWRQEGTTARKSIVQSLLSAWMPSNSQRGPSKKQKAQRDFSALGLWLV